MNINKIKNIIISIMLAIGIVTIPFMCGYLSAFIDAISKGITVLYLVLIGITIGEIGIISMLLMIDNEVI